MLQGPRKPWLAVVLTLICPGLGHLYCGRIVACLIFFLLSLVVVPAALAAVLAPPSDAVLAMFLVASGAMLVLGPWALVDAWRSARRAPADFAAREYQRPVVYALLVAAGLLCPVISAAALRGSFLRAFRIASDSMEPALRKGDFVFANGVRYQVRDVRRGDIVTFREPGGRRTLVKRVVGLPGDRVEVRDGEVLLNGERWTSSAADGPPPVPRAGPPGPNGTDDPAPGKFGAAPRMPEFRLAPEEVFVLSELLAGTRDSRHFGPVRVRDLDGPVEYRYWSRDGLSGIGAIEERE